MYANFSDTVIEKEDSRGNRFDVKSGDVRFEFQPGYKLFSLGFIIPFSLSRQPMRHYAKVDSHPFQPQCYKFLLSLPLSFDVEGPYFFNGTTAPRGPGPPLCREFMITLKHTTG